MRANAPLAAIALLTGSLFATTALAQAPAAPAAPAPPGAAPTVTVQIPAAPAPVRVTLNPATTAVFVSDMIDPICKNQPKCTGTMVPAVAALLAQARKAGVLVVYSTQAANQSKFLPEVAPASGDPFIPAQGQDRFYNNDLDNTLKAKGITTVVLTGWKIDGSILYTSSGRRCGATR